jgi:hypothetical protein
LKKSKIEGACGKIYLTSFWHFSSAKKRKNVYFDDKTTIEIEAASEHN